MPDFRALFSAPDDSSSTAKSTDFRALFSAPDQAAPSTTEDVAKSFGTGLEREMASLAGTPGDVRSLLAAGIEKYTGTTLPTIPGWAKAAVPMLRTSEDYMRPLQAAGLVHNPQTTAGEYARTVGEFAPSAFGGVEGLAGRAARYVLAPAVASETAGQLTKGTAAEPWARAAGSLVGMGGAGAVRGAIAEREALPTTEALKARSQAAYAAAKDAGVVVAPESFDTMVKGMRSEVEAAGFDPELHPKAAAALNVLEKRAGTPKTLEQMDANRQIVSDVAKSPEAGDRRIGQIMKASIDDHLNNLSDADVTAGHPLVAVNTLRQARSLWQQKAKSELLDNVFQNAKDTAGQFSVSGMENALRSEFRKLARNKKQMRTFTADEQAAIRKVGRGGPVENALRLIGKFAPTGVVPIAGATYLGGPAAGLGAGVMAGVGAAGRAAATAMTRRNANRVRHLMLSGELPAKTPGSPVSAALSGRAALLNALGF